MIALVMMVHGLILKKMNVFHAYQNANSVRTLQILDAQNVLRVSSRVQVLISVMTSVQVDFHLTPLRVHVKANLDLLAAFSLTHVRAIGF